MIRVEPAGQGGSRGVARRGVARLVVAGGAAAAAAQIVAPGRLRPSDLVAEAGGRPIGIFIVSGLLDFAREDGARGLDPRTTVRLVLSPHRG